MPTISDVAKRAGVSPGTVSRVMNGAPNVAVEIREKVEQAIEALGYRPNVAAQSLRSKRTRTLALLVPDITNIFWTTIARGVEDAAQSRDYSVLLCNTDQNPAKQLRYLNIMASQRVDGVVIAPYDSNPEPLARLRERNIPTVAIDRRINDWDVDSVYGDSVSGARALIQHLINLGHRRIGMISGPPTVSTARDRVAGYCIALTEAGIPVDPRLIKYGEYRSLSGEHLTDHLLDEGLAPTAIFAANNAIAVGVIDSLEKRGRQIPLDVALVSFGDFHHDSRFFPFLTAVVQPAYEIGMNAAQLLFSRLDAEINVSGRQIVLPTRLLVRYSCGSRLDDEGFALSLPTSREVETRSFLVKPLTAGEIAAFSDCLVGTSLESSGGEAWQPDTNKPDVNRLLTVLRHQEADRLPCLELTPPAQPLLEYVLERSFEAENGGNDLGWPAPEHHVEFARRLGIDAVICDFSWRLTRRGDKPRAGFVTGWADLDDLVAPPALTDQLSNLEAYLKAARGTGVGVVAGFTSFFEIALQAAGLLEKGRLADKERLLVETLMDMLLQHQEKVIRTVCDRFAPDLAFVLIRDTVAGSEGLLLEPALFAEVFPARLKRLIAPAREHGKPVVLHTAGRLDNSISLLADIGVDGLGPVDPRLNDIFSLRKGWLGKMAFFGGFPAELLQVDSPGGIEAKVKEYSLKLAGGGGYILGSTGLDEAVSPQHFVTMTRAVVKYGRYGALGQES